MAGTEIIENTPSGQNVVGSITTDDGFTVESNSETSEQLAAAIPALEATPVASAPKPSAPEPRKRNRRDDPRAAVEAAVGKQREAERAAKETADRIAALEAENAELKKPKPAPVVAAVPLPSAPVAAAPAPTEPLTRGAYARYVAMPDAPKIENYKGDNAFAEWQFDVSEFVADKRFAENMQRAQRGQQIAQQQTRITARIQEETAKDPTFQQRFNATPVDTRLVPYLHAHQQGGDIMAYLVDHQDLAQELASLQPDQRTELPSAAQIERIGEIVATLKTQSAAASSPASARPAISQAKPPTKRVSGAPPAATDEPPDDDASEQAHEAYWGPRRQEFRSARRAHR